MKEEVLKHYEFWGTASGPTLESTGRYYFKPREDVDSGSYIPDSILIEVALELKTVYELYRAFDRRDPYFKNRLIYKWYKDKVETDKRADKKK